MNFKRFAPIALSLLLIVGFAGCAKKVRPVPYDTVTQTGAGGGAGSGLNAEDVGTFAQGQDAFPQRTGMAAEGERGLLPTVYFDFDSSSIKPLERQKLSQVASFLQENPGVSIIAEGHCDWRGTTEYNLALGDRRASSVKSYLVTLGINPARINTKSEGDLQATEGASAAVMARDRKVEFLVVR